MAIKDRLIQYIMRGKDELSPEAKKAAAALDAVRTAGQELTAELDKAKDAQGLLVTFKTTGAAAERIRTTLERTEKRAADLRAELDQSPKSKGLASSLRAAEREAAKAARELDKLTAETKRTEAAAQAAGINTRNFAEEEKRLAAEVDKAKAAVDGNTKQLRELERQQRTTSRATAEHASRVDSAKQAMDSAGKRVLAFVAAYISLNAALGLVRRGFGLVKEGIGAFISSGSDSEQAIAQLNAALNATGSAAGFTAEQLLKMAEQLRDDSMFSTEQIIDAQTRLLSYTDVVGEQFPQAMQIVIDQAQRLGISVEQSAETVGQALQSPGKAMAALGRQGFTLEEGQKKLLIKLEATGKMAEAQAIIMDMLNESYGGAAAAAKIGTAQGLWQGLKDELADFFGMVSSSGAFDFVKGKLQEWGDTISRLKDDGKLQQLAEALSNAFIQGAEKVEQFIKSLARVDFNTLIEDSSAWLNSFGQHIDETMTRVKLFFAPFRTLLNGVTSGISVIGYTIARVADGALIVIAEVAKAIPDMLGGDKLRAGVASARSTLFGMTRGLVEQIEQDGQDIRDAWDTTTQHGVNSQQDAADAAAKAEKEKRAAVEATAAKVEELNERFKQSALDAAVAGTRAITDMADAMKLIDTASTVQQLEGLKEALHDAYRKGTISQEEYNNGLSLTNARIKELGGASEAAKRSINDVVKSLEDFVGLQQAIKGAQTDVDISKLATATREMYSAGKLTADEYRKALEALEKQKEAVAKATGSQAQAESNLAAKSAEAAKALREKAAADKAAAESADEATDSEQRRMTTTQKGIGVMIMGFRRLAYYATEAANEAATAHITQRAQIDELTASYSAGAISLNSYLGNLRMLQGTLKGLDVSGMQHLESAIAGAEQQMRSLGDSARSTLDSVRDELDRLRGDEEAIERRRMASRRRELQAQLAEARASGNASAASDINQAISMLGAIAKETAFVREQEQRQNRRESTQATAPGGGTQQPATTSTTPATVIRLESARGSAVDVAVQPGQEDALLSLLEQAGLRTI